MEIERGARFKCDEHHKFYLNPAKSQFDGIEGCLRDILFLATPELGKCRLPTKWRASVRRMAAQVAEPKDSPHQIAGDDRHVKNSSS